MANDLLWVKILFFYYRTDNKTVVFICSKSDVEFICNGQSGHGSLFLKNTPGKKVQFLINKFMDLRDVEEKKLESNSNIRIGDVTTVNLTMINGGVQNNVIPGEMRIVFDIRLAVDVDHDEFERMVIKFQQRI